MMTSCVILSDGCKDITLEDMQGNTAPIVWTSDMLVPDCDHGVSSLDEQLLVNILSR
jgi:hypothetical protein